MLEEGLISELDLLCKVVWLGSLADLERLVMDAKDSNGNQWIKSVPLYDCPK